MPNITRGGRMGGVLAYLVGAGRRNEHEEPHLVAGSPVVMAWHGDAVLSRAQALEIARELDAPRRVFGVSVKRPVRDPETRVRVGERDAHVWHCSLSLCAEEGVLDDERWAQICERFVQRMGFVDPDGAAPCRWVAVHHGPSAAGNDHVHVVVGLVHEDGRKADVHLDRPRAQQAARELEREFGLEVVEGRAAGRGTRGHQPAEQELADRHERVELPRVALARTVRACAHAAGDEAEFVRRLRRAGVRVKPRYASGRDDVVAGYAVAVRPGVGESTAWFGGGRLARDLTLPRLRAGWPQSTPQSASAAVAEWQAVGRGRPVAAPGREAHEEVSAEVWSQAVREVAALRERLRAVPVDDRATWAMVAQETAGAFAAWSERVEPTPGPLAATADVLARSGQVRASVVRPRSAGWPSARGAAYVLASIAHQGRGPAAHAALAMQLANTVKALHDAHRAAGELRAAREIEQVVRGQLAAVTATLEQRPGVAVDAQAAEAVRIAQQGRVPRAPGSPVPAVELDHQPSTEDRAQMPGRARPAARPSESGLER